jgi:hypothetical protein
VERELREVNHSLNRFLQVHFRLEIESLQEYLHRVKDLLVELTTRQSSALSNIFSKFSNILQPFTSYSYDLSLDALKLETTTLRDANRHLRLRLDRYRAQLDEYRLKSAKAMDFIYLLRVNAVDVDAIMRAGVMRTKVEEWGEEEGEVRRAAEVVGELGVGLGAGVGLGESSLSSQYVSVKSKR